MPPIHLLVKPVSGRCNMRCTYCFYTDEVEKRDCGLLENMSMETLEEILKKTLKFSEGVFSITFQGGEPTLAGLDFYRKAIEYTNRWNVNQCRVDYALQTNGYILTKEWAEFFADNQFTIGVSLDGYQELHDRYRKNARGEGTFSHVMENIRLLESYGIDLHILTVVHRETALHTGRVYRFLKKNGMRKQQYIECMDPFGEKAGQEDYSLTPEQYGQFLIDLYRNWYQDLKRGDYVYIRYFDNLLGMLKGNNPESCSMCGICSHQWVIESDGSVFPCDFYAMDQWKIGNLRTDSVAQIERKRKELAFVEMSAYVPEECRYCQWYLLCRNGCRRNCEFVNRDRRDKNYFCRAYREFFSYAYPGLLELGKYVR